MKRFGRLCLPSIAVIVAVAPLANAQPSPDGPGGVAARQDARLLQNANEAEPENPPSESGSIFGLRLQGAIIGIPHQFVAVSPAGLGIDIGGDFSSKYYLGAAFTFGLVLGHSVDGHFGLLFEVHPLGTAKLSPSIGLTAGYEAFEKGGAFVGVPLGLDFRREGTRVRSGVFFTPALTGFADWGLSVSATIGVRTAF